MLWCGMSEANLPFFVAVGASGSEGLEDIMDLLSAWLTPPLAVVMVVLHRPSDKSAGYGTFSRLAAAYPWWLP